MIIIDAAYDNAGLLRSCKVQGHAGSGSKGADIVCAAVSVLVRTALRTLSGRDGITIRGGAPERGLLWMEADYTAEGREFLSAAGSFLTEGLKSVSEEYPDYCEMNINTEWRN
jgi:uncharacterized protein YsxB (DUF464 family)